MKRKPLWRKDRVILMTLAAIMATPGLAQDDNDHDHGQDHEHEHSPGAHVHGEAMMQLGIEGDRAEVILDTPAVNIIGFERPPRNEEEEAALESVVEHFRNEPLMKPGQEADECQVENAEVQSALLDENGEAWDDGHAEFNVAQELTCSASLAEGEIHAAVLDAYPDIERLRLEWISDDGQGAAELTPAEPVFRTH